MQNLGGSQVRQLIDTEQAYEEWRRADREKRSRFSGSMTWKVIGGRRYLYRKQQGVGSSLGPENAETSLVHHSFHTGRDAVRARLASLDATIRAMAPVNRAMRLGRVPWMSARLLRRLDRIGVLGHGLRVAGTHALYAYERMAGVQLASDLIATADIDLLYDARGGLDLVGSGLADMGLLGVLRELDASFAATGVDSFRAANAAGFMVDLITPSSRNPATRIIRSRLGDAPEDLSAVEIEGLGWLESSPVIETTIIDERGYPLTIVVPDPRAFVCHKFWVSDRDDREPMKARRDRAQALAIGSMLQTHLPHLRFDDPALGAVPAALRDRAARAIEELRVASPDSPETGEWA